MKTSEEIATEVVALKEKYPVSYTLSVPVNEDETEIATIILRKIDRITYKAASKLIEKDWEIAAEMMIKTLYIGGDELSKVLPSDPELKFEILRAAEKQIAQIMKAKEAFLKKN